MTIRQLFLETTGQAHKRTTTTPMLMGQVFEAPVVEWYLARHPGYTWDASKAHHRTAPLVRGRLHCHPDGLITLPRRDKPSVNGEVKVPRMPWFDGVPLHAQWQAQGQMAVTGFEACVIVECVDLEVRGDEIVHIHCREHLIERDETVHEAIMEACDRFFTDHVLPRRPPPAEARDVHDMRREAPDESAVELPEHWVADLAHYETLTAERKRLNGDASKITKLLEAWEAQAIDAMGSAETAHLPDGTILRRKKTERRGHVVAPSTTWHLKIERKPR